MRIEEPFLKGHIALWLVTKGAKHITVSVDGAEPNPGAIQQVLERAGYHHQVALQNSKVGWKGNYISNGGVEIVVVSLPGPDVGAALPGERRCVIECKGEPTPKGVKAGRERRDFCTGLGQLILAAKELPSFPNISRILALADTPGLRKLAQQESRNPLLSDMRISFLLVDGQGKVTEVQ